MKKRKLSSRTKEIIVNNVNDKLYDIALAQNQLRKAILEAFIAWKAAGYFDKKEVEVPFESYVITRTKTAKEILDELYEKE